MLAAGGADPSITNRFGITPLMVAAGLDTWEGETPGPFTGVPEAERLEAVKLAIELGNDINAVADFGDYPMTGDPTYTLLYYPHNIQRAASSSAWAIRAGAAARRCTARSSRISRRSCSTSSTTARTLDAKTETGWTPLMMTRGVFLANTGREFPAAEAILVKALAARDAR